MRDAGDLQRVFVTLRDGKWHGAQELQTVGGQNFGARIRELREERCGALTVECRKNPKGQGSQYRLEPRQISEAIEDLILAGKVPPRKRATESCPTCLGKGRVAVDPLQPALEDSDSESFDTTRWNHVFDTLAG